MEPHSCLRRDHGVRLKEEQAVGASTVDEQHQQLFIRGGSPKLDVDRVVSELERHTKFHFSAEERVLKGMGVAEMFEHKKQHSRFVTEIAKTRRRDVGTAPPHHL